MVGFNYRRMPAIALARQLVAEGTLGTLRHVRAAYLQDWLVDPTAPMSWRLRKETAGSGALGDLGAHLVDLVRYLTGDEPTGLSGHLTTFVQHRPGSAEDRVTVDDAALFTVRLASGAIGSFEATRYATGRKNALRIELDGEHGSIGFDLERPNELAVHNRTAPSRLDGFRRVLVTEPDHPYLSAWWPPGHVLGWEHTFVHQARDLLLAIADGTQPTPSFADGLAVQRVLAAVEDSAGRQGAWIGITS
jgi:predicted dehydrogenase